MLFYVLLSLAVLASGRSWYAASTFPPEYEYSSPSTPRSYPRWSTTTSYPWSSKQEPETAKSTPETGEEDYSLDKPMKKVDELWKDVDEYKRIPEQRPLPFSYDRFPPSTSKPWEVKRALDLNPRYPRTWPGSKMWKLKQLLWAMRRLNDSLEEPRPALRKAIKDAVHYLGEGSFQTHDFMNFAENVARELVAIAKQCERSVNGHPCDKSGALIIEFGEKFKDLLHDLALEERMKKELYERGWTPGKGSFPLAMDWITPPSLVYRATLFDPLINADDAPVEAIMTPSY
ncbi:hypothetical protein Q1695_011305 [Nippostrongylus brasiliensis]|nr:hypothetical protein Q1695_011305 [Nippostrongylus brasiliensis]